MSIVPLPERWPVGRPYSNSRRLWAKGHRINGRTAWRLRSKEFALPYGKTIRHHSKYALGKRWVDFGRDWVYVRQADGSRKRHGRVWWLPFIVQVWVSCDFSSARTIHRLKYGLGLNVAKDFGERIFMWHIKKRWKEVEEYAMKTKLFDVEKYIERHDKVLAWAEEKMKEFEKPGEQLEAANLAERGLGRIIGVVMDVEKKAKTEADFEDTKGKILDAINRVADEKDKAE